MGEFLSFASAEWSIGNNSGEDPTNISVNHSDGSAEGEGCYGVSRIGTHPGECAQVIHRARNFALVLVYHHASRRLQSEGPSRKTQSTPLAKDVGRRRLGATAGCGENV